MRDSYSAISGLSWYSSAQALNDLFEKILLRDVPARYLLRLGMGEQELATTLDFSRVGRVNAMLARRLELLAEVDNFTDFFEIPYHCLFSGLHNGAWGIPMLLRGRPLTPCSS